MNFKIHDDYTTPNEVWDYIAPYIPKDKVVWEAFYCDGKSGEYLRSLGFKVIHEKEDFFKCDRGDICVSNPPFSKAREVLQRLVDIDKPFMLILPSAKISTQYFRKIFKDRKIQIMITPKRIKFNKIVDGKIPEGYKSRPFADCFVYCYKMNFASDIIFL